MKNLLFLIILFSTAACRSYTVISEPTRYNKDTATSDNTRTKVMHSQFSARAAYRVYMREIPDQQSDSLTDYYVYKMNRAGRKANPESVLMGFKHPRVKGGVVAKTL